MSRCGCTSPSCSCVFDATDDFAWSGSGTVGDPFVLATQPSRALRVICTSATRPASPAEGWEIYETDTNHTLYYDGTKWKYRPETEIARVERDSFYSVTASTLGAATDLFSSDLTWTADGDDYDFEFFSPQVNSPTGGDAYTAIYLTDGGSNGLGALGIVGPGDGTRGKTSPVLSRIRVAPAAGSYSVNVRGIYITSSGGIIYAGVGGGTFLTPAYLRILAV